MATRKLQYLFRFLPFLPISNFQTRGSGAGAPSMGHVIHQNDRLIKHYQDEKKIMRKKIILYPWQQDNCHFFRIFGRFWGFLHTHTRGSRAGAPNMFHVIHQNDCLIKQYQDERKKWKVLRRFWPLLGFSWGWVIINNGLHFYLKALSLM